MDEVIFVAIFFCLQGPRPATPLSCRIAHFIIFIAYFIISIRIYNPAARMLCTFRAAEFGFCCFYLLRYSRGVMP